MSTMSIFPAGSPFFLQYNRDNDSGFITPPQSRPSFDRLTCPNAPARIRNSVTYNPLGVRDDLSSLRRDLFGASHPVLVKSAQFFEKMIEVWQFMPDLSDQYIMDLRQNQLNKWNWLYVVPMNTGSNISSAVMTPVVAVINLLAITVFLGKYSLDPNSQNLKCLKFFMNGFQVSLVLGFLNLSKALFPGMPIKDIYNQYKKFIGFSQIAEDL